MKVTQTTSLQQNRPAERKAVIGGGWITTPGVAAHVRRMVADTGPRVPENRPLERKAVIGGGWITTPGVAAHVRRKMAGTGQAPDLDGSI